MFVYVELRKTFENKFPKIYPPIIVTMIKHKLKYLLRLEIKIRYKFIFWTNFISYRKFIHLNQNSKKYQH